MKEPSRRTFLRAVLATAASPLLPGKALAGSADDYRALVCVLLEGGADSFNMVVPTGSSDWNRYRQLRGDMAVPRGELLPLGGSSWGLHPRLRRLHQRFEGGELAIVANVGTLVQPVGQAEAAAGEHLPANLFSHNSQRDLWMTADARRPRRTGWAGRLADVLGGGPFFNISVTSPNLMQRGSREALVIASDIYPFDDFYRLRDGDTDMGLPYRRMIQAARTHANPLVEEFARTRQAELDLFEEAAGMLDGIETHVEFPWGEHETGRPVGDQLAQVARIIQARQISGRIPGDPARQLFFVNYHGWDTHNTPLNSDSHLLDYLDEALDAFYRELRLLGMESQVTTFTISDFGRSLTPNGAGTDHGWGGHALVMGGAVSGGIHGRMPAMEPGSPDALEGRMIPGLAVEQYLEPLARWLGLESSGMPAVFPNRGSFPAGSLSLMV